MSAAAARVLAGDRRAAARLISQAEVGDSGIVSELQVLYRAGGRARVVGVTGPPGAGKSTLVDAMISAWRAQGVSVAVLAVDPSSPFSGGAVLGDRVRMARHAEDAGVMIRSMATRGELGGLAAAAGDAVTILDALGFDRIVIETVGVGQNEVDILAHAEVVLVLQTALGGDAVQVAKAGILEIADILVVNKKRAAGSERMIHALMELAHDKAGPGDWTIPVIAAEALEGEGVAEILRAIFGFFEFVEGDVARRRRRLRARVLALAQRLLRRRLHEGVVEAVEWAELEARRMDPHEIAERMMRR